MRIAVEGCCHGQLDEIYKAIADRERSGGFKVDLLLICGDFQAIRNEADLEAMAVPRKYLELGTFHKYYSGEQVAPIPTIFIGGNHESSSYLWELYHGGWVCPNIYFLGWGNVINVGGLRIGGMSGIYKAAHYNTGHYEVSPLNDNHKRSIYHIRKFDVFKMIQVKEPLDVFLSHDWPRGIEQFGDVDGLVRRKPHFREEIRNNDLGSTPYEQILHALKPAHWFSAHLHVRFTATVPWTAGQQEQQQQLQSQSLSEPPSNPDEINIDFEDDDPSTMTTSDTAADAAAAVSSNPDEIQIGLSDDEDSATPPVNSSTLAEAVDSADSKEIKVGEADKEGESTGDGCQTVESTQEDTNTQLKPVVPTTETLSTAPLASQCATQQRRHPNVTRFLALDKCLPKRQYLEIIDFPDVNEPVEFRYDQEWLAIVRTLDQYMSLQHSQPPAPEGKRLERELKENRRWVQENITGEKLQIPNNFVQTTPAHNPIHTLGPKEKHDYSK
ncbi:lariat debranching enzyme [Actinomortierella wolfii]|nr:lariat debranching enzyme [Actinomortierella wolfii]